MADSAWTTTCANRPRLRTRDLGQIRFVFIGLDPSARLHQSRENGRVVAGPGPHMDCGLARLRVDGRKPCGVQGGLAVVDAARAVDHHENVVVEIGDIGGAP